MKSFTTKHEIVNLKIDDDYLDWILNNIQISNKLEKISNKLDEIWF